MYDRAGVFRCQLELSHTVHPPSTDYHLTPPPMNMQPASQPAGLLLTRTCFQLYNILPSIFFKCFINLSCEIPQVVCQWASAVHRYSPWAKISPCRTMKCSFCPWSVHCFSPSFLIKLACKSTPKAICFTSGIIKEFAKPQLCESVTWRMLFGGEKKKKKMENMSDIFPILDFLCESWSLWMKIALPPQLPLAAVLHLSS